MKDGRKPKDVMRGKLATGDRPVGCAALSLKDVCRVTSNSQLLADDRSGWRRAVREDREGRGTVQPTSGGQDTTKEAVTEMSGHRSIPYNRLGKDCYPRIGLPSHSKTLVPTGAVLANRGATIIFRDRRLPTSNNNNDRP